MRQKSWLLLPLLLLACQHEQPTLDGFGQATLMSEAASNGATPMFLTTPSGDQIISWVTEPAANTPSSMLFQIRSGNGAAPRMSVFRDTLGGVEPHGEAPPQIAAGPDSTLYVLYLVGKDVGQRYPAGALRFVRSDDGGRSWNPPVSVNEGEVFGSHNFHGLTAGPDGSVYATWLSNTGKAAVWLRVSRDGGRTWGKARAISIDEACPCCRTAVAVSPSGKLYLAYRNVAAGDVRDIVVMSSTDHGETWSAAVKPREDGWVFPGCPHAGPALKVDQQGVVHISWWTGKSGSAGVWYARSADQGITWTPTAVDIAEKAAPMHVQIVVDTSGKVVVAWDGGKSAIPQVWVRASADHGLTFGAAAALSDPKLAATFPVLGLRGDSLTVAWTQIADSAYRALLHHQAEPEGANDRMALPRVGQQEIFSRMGLIGKLVK